MQKLKYLLPILIAVMFISCDEDNNNNSNPINPDDTTSIPTGLFAIKAGSVNYLRTYTAYVDEDGDTLLVDNGYCEPIKVERGMRMCFDNYGKKVYYESEDHYKVWSGFIYDNVNNKFYQINSTTKKYKVHYPSDTYGWRSSFLFTAEMKNGTDGYTKQGNRNIAGKLCDVCKGGSIAYPTEIAGWNGIIFYYSAGNGSSIREATSFSESLIHNFSIPSGWVEE